MCESIGNNNEEMIHEVSRSQFNLNEGWKVVDLQTRDVVAQDSMYDSRRMDAFVKQTCRPSLLGRDFRPWPQDRNTFINALLTKHIEVTDGLDPLGLERNVRIAELAFIMDGLYGMEYSDLGKIYRPSVKHVAKEGSYTIWQRALTRTARLTKEELER